MKKIILILFGLMLFAGLFAQRGLFNLAFDITMSEADSILAVSGFFPEGSEEDAVKYYSDINLYVSAIIVFMEPDTKRVAGWFIRYNSENGADNDHLIMQKISHLHGETNHFDEDTQQLIWFLTDTRTLHVMYAYDGSLTALYYNALFPELFSLRENQE
ncbi:MAG: hypothetical protein PHY41_07535 [Candidatus Cloacimonetes bacterium]|nr:hypothetical protein [Candidatus Cloacimonadota bacterium]MDY0299305.1 hypothetical protein [Candidatus Cloacimonadaceae bacterium]MDD2210754.1 hypothetical protein [Candidatus Cloacimonadota bacterium]MDD3283307.1 hypothetical protein [Candidatus Cloacimonadota bacterium]MDD4231643.1 hypothetical protein [Candidatus Cloacimonadota bacterium]